MNFHTIGQTPNTPPHISFKIKILLISTFACVCIASVSLFIVSVNSLGNMKKKNHDFDSNNIEAIV